MLTILIIIAIIIIASGAGKRQTSTATARLEREGRIRLNPPIDRAEMEARRARIEAMEAAECVQVQR